MVVFISIISCIIVLVVVKYLYQHTTPHIHSPYWNKTQKQFAHPWPLKKRIISLQKVWKYILTKKTKWPKHLQHVASPNTYPKPEKTKIINVGHATFLIQTAHANILTDPVFSMRAGPLGIFGPKRVIEPGVALELLPHIDIIIISHNHFDHLDKFSVLTLAAYHDVTFIVPLGLKRTLTKWGIQRPIIELDWWQHTHVQGITLTATPAQHWSRRSLWDTNKTFWMGVLIQDTQHECGNIYFAGDTGFGPHFQEIHAHAPNIDVALLPIGSYEPRDIMKEQHMNPKEAIEACKLLKAHTLIPIHYDVFPLGAEPFKGAEIEFQTHLNQEEYLPFTAHILPVGAWFEITQNIK